MKTFADLVATNPIHIVSGEGIEGATELYTGIKSIYAIELRLAKERKGGRWARASIYSHTNSGGDVYVDLENQDYCSLRT